LANKVALQMGKRADKCGKRTGTIKYLETWGDLLKKTEESGSNQKKKNGTKTLA